MLKGLGDLGNIMKLQKEMKRMQKEMKRNETTGQSSDGMIRVVVNGEFEIKRVSISEDQMMKGTASQIEKNIQDAVNNAINENKRITAEKMKELTGGMDLGALGGMLG